MKENFTVLRIVSILFSDPLQRFPGFCCLLILGLSLTGASPAFARQDLFSQARTLTAEKQFAEAERVFSEILADAPYHLEARIGRGYARQQQGKLVQAFADYNLALELAPDHVEALANRAGAWFQKARPNRALLDCERLVALAPNSPQAWLLRGTVRQSVGLWLGARQDFEQALRRAPGNPVVLNQLAWLLATCPESSRRDGDRAAKLAGLALKHRADPALLDTLAAAHAESGRFEKAAELEQRVIRRSRGLVPGEKIKAYEDRLSSYREAKPWYQPGPGLPPFTIQIAACQDRDIALSTSEELLLEGIPAFCSPVEIPDMGIWYRIHIDRYASRSAAEAAAARELESRFGQVQIVERPFALAVDETDAQSEAGRQILREVGCQADPAGRIGAFETAEEALNLAGLLQKKGVSSRLAGPENPPGKP